MKVRCTGGEERRDNCARGILCAGGEMVWCVLGGFEAPELSGQARGEGRGGGLYCCCKEPQTLLRLVGPAASTSGVASCN